MRTRLTRHLSLWAALLTVGLVGSGCRTTVPDARQQADIAPPAEWSTPFPEAVRDSETWLRVIGGASLEELVAEALAHNRDLAAAAARLRQSAAQARLAGAARWAEVGAGFSASRSKSVIPNPLPPGASPAGGPELPDLLETQTTRFDLSAELAWEADLWGRLGDSARAAQASNAAAMSDYEGARLALAGGVARRWLEYVEATLQSALAAETAENFVLNERLLSRRFEAGLSSALDVRLARTSARAAAAEVVAREQQSDALARALEVLLGRFPDRSLAIEGEWRELADLPNPGIPAEIVRRRPDLRAAEARFAASVYERGATAKLRYPRLTLNASAGTASTELGDLLNSEFGVWSLVGGLTAPIFTAGRIGARIDAARAAEEAALEDFAATLLGAYREVETALAAEVFFARQEARIADLVKETTLAEEEAWRYYERGLADIGTVLEAQRGAFESASQLIAVQAQRRLNRVTLHLALGGGYSSEPTIDSAHP